jgi:hypothetical protein
MIWIIVIGIILFLLVRFLFDMNKDNYDLQGQSVSEKFKFVVEVINDTAFNGMGQVVPLDKRSFNLYQDGENQIIYFTYSTGHLTIIWRYKFLQKEIVHEKMFSNVRNLSLFEQQRIGQAMLLEMDKVILNHQEEVMKNS